MVHADSPTPLAFIMVAAALGRAVWCPGSVSLLLRGQQRARRAWRHGSSGNSGAGALLASGGASHTFGVWGQLFVLVEIGAILVFLFWPFRIALSEWNFMIDGEGDAAPNVFNHIAWAFQKRETPVAFRVQRLHLGQSASRDYLFVQDGVFRGYVSAFSYGRDLYIGWTYWWRLSPWGWGILSLRRLWQTMTLRGSELHRIHRYDRAGALREAIHGAAREGVDAATGVVPLQGKGTVGSDIPVEVIDGDARREVVLPRAS